MKKLLPVFLFLLTLVFQSCEDTVTPKIILDGNSNMEHILNQAFVDPGYTAFDDMDGDITGNVTVSELNVDSAGIHVITYSVSDAAGNTAEVSRTVNVYNQMLIMNGNWSGEYVFPYPGIVPVAYIDSLSASVTTNMNIVFKNFGGTANANLTGKVVLSGVPDAPAIAFSGQSVGGLAFSAESARITDNFSRITIEYTIGAQDGVLVLVKQ